MVDLFKKEAEEILSVEAFKNKIAEMDALPVEELISRFTPFKIGHDFRRNCEIDYYGALAEKLVAQYEKEEFSFSGEDLAVFFQNLAFVHLQQGNHAKAREYYDRAEKNKDKIDNEDIRALFEARQAQIQGPLLREFDQDTEKAIAVLTSGVKLCETLAGEEYYSTLANIQRDLALCYLKQGNFEEAQRCFESALKTAEKGGMYLFGVAIKNYIALSKAYLGSTESIALFEGVAQWYEKFNGIYQGKHREDGLADCQDWGSHLFHSGIGYFLAGKYDEAIVQFKRAVEYRKKLVQGQLYNRVADVYLWIAKCCCEKEDLGGAEKYAGWARNIYQYHLDQLDKNGIARADAILGQIPINERYQAGDAFRFLLFPKEPGQTASQIQDGASEIKLSNLNQ